MADASAKAERLGIEIARALSLLGILGFVVLAVGTIADVMLRWLFASPIDGFSEVARLGVAIMTATFLPAALIERYHISIDFFGKWMGPDWHRGLNLFSAAVTLGFFSLMAWQFVGYTQELADAGETTWIVGIKVAPYWWVVTGILALCVPAQILILMRAYLRDPELPDHPDQAPQEDAR